MEKFYYVRLKGNDEWFMSMSFNGIHARSIGAAICNASDRDRETKQIREIGVAEVTDDFISRRAVGGYIQARKLEVEIKLVAARKFSTRPFVEVIPGALDGVSQDF